LTNDPADPRNDPNMVRVPFIFVKRGDRPPLRWMAEHPGYLKVPAIMVPHGTQPPWPWGGARARPPQVAQAPTPEVEPRIPGSFAPPPKRRKRQPGGQPWPKDKNGRDWPQDRWGRPMRPLWDYPPGVRAPGEGVAPGDPGSVSTADAINAYLKAEAVFANPMRIRRAASAAPDLPEIAGTDPAPTATDAPETQVATALAIDDTPRQATAGLRTAVSDQNPSVGPQLRGNASFYNPGVGTPTASSTGFDPTFYGAAMYGRPGFRLGDVVRVQLQDDPTRFVDVRVNDTGPFAIDARRHLVRPLRPNPDRVIDLTPAAMEALVGSDYANIGLVRVTVTRLPAGSREGTRGGQ
jgi:hypothetical protein